MKAFISSLLFTLAFGVTDWWLPSVYFDAIEQSSESEYTLTGMYGPNSRGFFGQYAYIYLEVSGAEISDGAVVTTWATVYEPDLPIYNISIDSLGNEVLVQNGTTATPWVERIETTECRVIFKHNRGLDDYGRAYNYAPANDVDVRTYRGNITNSTITEGGRTLAYEAGNFRFVWEEPYTFYESNY